MRHKAWLCSSQREGVGDGVELGGVEEGEGGVGGVKRDSGLGWGGVG